MKPICVPCRRFYRPKKNGVYFLEGMPIENDAMPGTTEPEKWKPYKLWNGDKWECQGCGATIIVGCGGKPVAEHYQKHFEEYVEKLSARDFQVNDC